MEMNMFVSKIWKMLEKIKPDVDRLLLVSKILKMFL